MRLVIKIILCVFLFVVWLPAINAQTVLENTLPANEKGKSLTSFFYDIAKRNQIRFFFLHEWVDSIQVEENYEGKTLGETLDHLFAHTDLSYFLMYPQQVVILKNPRQQILREQALAKAIRQQKRIIKHQFGKPHTFKKDERITLSGNLIDYKTREPILQADIQINENQTASSDEKGHYSLVLVPGEYTLNFRAANHEDKVVDLIAYADGEISLEMDELPIMLNEILIVDKEGRDLTTSSIGQIQLSMKEIKRTPAMLGEVDLIKQVQTLPGVTTAGEAASGFNVRGGSVDQNLILYDGMPVFNSSHVFGFFSSFNPESIREVSFLKGGIPAEYGGRASSVLTIRSKDGDLRKWNGSAGLGMITSNLMLNGPLVKEKTSLAASFRSTYSNWLIHSIHTNYADLSKSSVFFYDGTIKLTHLISDRTKLSLTGYASKDAFRLVGDTTYQWNNAQLSARLDHQFSSSLSSEFIVGVSSYDYSVVNADYLTASKLIYKITTSVLKAGFHYQAGAHSVNFGWHLLDYQFNPGTFTPNSQVSNAKSITIDQQNSVENAFYAGDALSINEKLFLEGGLRLPMFVSFGPAAINQYQSGVSRDLATVVDTLHFKSGQPIKTYFGIEPRLSVRWMAGVNSSFKLGYNRMYQFLHLVTNTTAVTPVDIWQPSGYYFKPQKADQLSLGYFNDFKEKRYTTSIETYYKAVQNVLDFKDGAQLILNKHLETDLLQGKGWSYGVETTLAKNAGRLTGSINYTYSRSFRQIAGPTASQSVNGGKVYPASFDQPHIVNLSWKYNLSRRYFFTGTWTYHTGRPVTIPLSAFQFENSTLGYYSDRNQYRIPDYHRLDIAVVFEGNHKRKKRGESTWVLSVYNVYGRRNAYSVFFKSDGNGIPQAYQLSILGSALPSISYNLKF